MAPAIRMKTSCVTVLFLALAVFGVHGVSRFYPSTNPNAWAHTESYGKGPKQSAVPDRTNTQQYAPKSPSGVPAPQGNRLPTDLAPYHQNIVLRPHIYSGDTDTFYFDGRTEIFFNVLKATNTFQINFQALAFSQGSIRITNLATGALVEWLTLELDEDDFTFTLALATSLEVGQKYKFECGYSGPLYQDFAGLYWDVYYKDDQPRYLVATQFQTRSARAAFPCFDEPAFKATFNVTLERQSNMTSICNMPAESTTAGADGWLADRYETTPVMSSYLLAMVVSDYVNVNMTSKTGLIHRIWVREARVKQAEFALNTSYAIVEWLEAFTDVRFPLPKLDHIALPNKGGAMENWGLITYSEGGLLYDGSTDDPYDRFSIGGLMGHETAHMWFGNIVTCQWWKHAWLNEGFATFFSNPPLLSKDPDLPTDLIGVFRSQGVMTIDDGPDQVPVVVNVQAPNELGVAFGQITYQKGATMVRQLSYIMTEAAFQRGIRKYLKRHLYGNVVTDNLWTAMTEQAAEDGIKDTDGSALDVKSKMDSWVLQQGFPRLTVTRNADGSVDVKQTVHLEDASQNITNPSPFNYKWNVPLSYTTSKEKNFTYVAKQWMNQGDIKLEGATSGSDDWIWVNNMHHGYVRVDYDEATRNLLVQQLVNDPTIVPAQNKMGLISDMFKFVELGRYQEIDAFRTTRFLGKETNIHVWQVAGSPMLYPDQLIRYRASFASFKKYIRKMADPVYAGISWNTDDERYLPLLGRYIMIPIACSFSNEDCLKQSHDRLVALKNAGSNEENPVRPEVRSDVYCYGLASPDATEDDWNFMYDRFMASTSSSEQSRIASGLVCTQNTDLMLRLLDWTLNGENVKYMQTIWWNAATNPIGRPHVWDHIRNNWQNTPLGGLKLSTLLVLAQTFSSQTELDQLNTLINNNAGDDDLENATFSQAKADLERNMNWINTNEATLVQFFDQETSGMAALQSSVSALPRPTKFNERTDTSSDKLGKILGKAASAEWFELARRHCEYGSDSCPFV